MLFVYRENLTDCVGKTLARMNYEKAIRNRLHYIPAVRQDLTTALLLTVCQCVYPLLYMTYDLCCDWEGIGR